MTGTETRFYRNGVLIDSPRNWKEIEIESNWKERKEKGMINIPSLNFVGEEATNIRTRIKDGLIGGVGIFEGDELTIQFGDFGNPIFTFEGYLNYANESTFIGQNEVVVALNQVQGVDWLNDVADGFSFASLYDEGIVKKTDFIKVPYVINYIPDNMQVIMLSIYTLMLTKELIENTYAIGEAVSEVVNASIPNAGLGVTWDFGDVAWLIIKVALRIAYTVFIAIAIYNSILELIEQLYPKKRNHLGMTIQTMFLRGCEKLNLTLDSNLLTQIKDWTILPSKFHKGEEPPKGEIEVGYPTNTDSFYTFGDLIRICMRWFNADYRLDNGVFKFEQKEYWSTTSSYIVPPTYVDQDKLQDSFDFNIEDFKSNVLFAYAFDVQDQNTLDNQEGRICQIITEPISVINQKLVNMQGLEEFRVDVSLGLEKTSYTNIEKKLLDLAKVADKILGIFGKNSNFKNKIQDRLNTLLLSSHFTSLPKVVVMNGSKLANNQRSLLSMEKIYDNYHYTNSFVPAVDGKHNQWILFPEKEVPFTKDDYVTLSDSNYCFLQTGEEARIDYLKWNPYKGTAVIKGAVKQLYTKNLKIRKVL